jgi:NAD+ synthase
MDYSKVSQNIVEWLAAYLKYSRSNGFVLGLSGGIDSSTTAVLCRKVTKDVLGVILPCHSSPDAERDARRIAGQYDIPIVRHDLSSAYDHLLKVYSATSLIPVPSKVVLGNIKARLRMISLYFHANRLSRLVVGSGNGVEIMLGYFTKFGDGGADIWPIGDLLKRDVRQMASILGLPADIVDKTPSADLWPGQTDEGEMGITYEVLDQILGGDSLEAIDPIQVASVIERIQKAKHKNPLLTPPSPGIVCPVQNLAKKVSRWKKNPRNR